MNDACFFRMSLDRTEGTLLPKRQISPIPPATCWGDLFFTKDKGLIYGTGITHVRCSMPASLLIWIQ